MTSRRAFALPLVLLLVLVCSVMLTVMLQRHSTSLLTTQRELDGYAFGHASRGMSDALDAWLKFLQRKTIAEALDEEGNAFSLSVEGGQELQFRLRDGQGLALATLSGLGNDNVRLGREILRRLHEELREDAVNFVRDEGPLAVSVNTAPPEVLRAVLGAITEDDSGDGLVADILSRREADGLIDPDSLQTLISGSELTEEFKAKAKALLTANPALWRVYAEVRWPGSQRPTAQYRAWAIVSRGATLAQGDRNASLQRSVAIFGWERVQEDEYPVRR